MKRRVLIVSPHFPPVNAPDMQRVRQALPYFLEDGWDVTVLTVADPTPTAPLEPELETTLPAAVRVVRAHCCSRSWTGLVGVNNVALRSLPFLFAAGRKLLRGHRYDVVYFSTTMFVCLPLGRLWKMLCGTPYVVDLQDPWISDFYDRPGAPRPPGGWKYFFAQGIGRLLEGWTLRGAGGLIAVSQAYLDTVHRRYPETRSVPQAEIPFGSPDNDLAQLRRNLGGRRRLLPANELRLAFAGALGPGQLEAVAVLFKAIAALRNEGVIFEVYFFGTSYAPGTKPVTLALAAQSGLQECVHEQPGRLRYFDALQVSLEADANLLFGSTDLAFTPSKLLALLSAGKPLVALAPKGSAMLERLRVFGQDAVSIASYDQAEAVAQAAKLLRDLAANRLSPFTAPTDGPGSARNVSRRQLDILTAALNP